MAATDFQNARYPGMGAFDVSYLNSSGGTISAGQCLKLDTAHPLSGTQGGISLTQTTAVTDLPVGIAVDNAPAGAQGRVQIAGLGWAIAAGAISIGATVGASGATSGDVIAYTATDPFLGQAMTAAVNAADPVLVLIHPGVTA